MAAIDFVLKLLIHTTCYCSPTAQAQEIWPVLQEMINCQQAMLEISASADSRKPLAPAFHSCHRAYGLLNAYLST